MDGEHSELRYRVKLLLRVTVFLLIVLVAVGAVRTFRQAQVAADYSARESLLSMLEEHIANNDGCVECIVEGVGRSWRFLTPKEYDMLIAKILSDVSRKKRYDGHHPEGRVLDGRGNRYCIGFRVDAPEENNVLVVIGTLDMKELIETKDIETVMKIDRVAYERPVFRAISTTRCRGCEGSTDCDAASGR